MKKYRETHPYKPGANVNVVDQSVIDDLIRIVGPNTTDPSRPLNCAIIDDKVLIRNGRQHESAVRAGRVGE